jgi:hypothetical protein
MTARDTSTCTGEDAFRLFAFMLELSRVVVRVAGGYRTLITILAASRSSLKATQSIVKTHPWTVVPPHLPLSTRTSSAAHFTDKSAETYNTHTLP